MSKKLVRQLKSSTNALTTAMNEARIARKAENDDQIARDEAARAAAAVAPPAPVVVEKSIDDRIAELPYASPERTLLILEKYGV